MQEKAEYLLVKRGLYYKPNNCGYTGVKELAGRYFKTDARPDAGVTAIHESRAPEYTAECFEDIKAAHIKSKLDRLRDQVRELGGQPCA